MKKRLVHGVGINDADYVVAKYETVGYVNGKQKQKLIWSCPYYETWRSMLGRCYSTKYQDKYPTYISCSVADEWLVFSKFRTWMQDQDWTGNQLDKDLLFDDNKVYSPENCVFVSPMVNTFVIDSAASRGQHMIGCCWNKRAKKFQAQCCNPFTKKQEYLGLYDCEQEAHEVWKKRKLELAHELAAIQTDERVAEALIKRYS